MVRDMLPNCDAFTDRKEVAKIAVRTPRSRKDMLSLGVQLLLVPCQIASQGSEMGLVEALRDSVVDCVLLVSFAVLDDVGTSESKMLLALAAQHFRRAAWRSRRVEFADQG